MDKTQTYGVDECNKQLAFAAIFSFLSDLKVALLELDPTVINNDAVYSSFDEKLRTFLNMHLRNFDLAIVTVFKNKINRYPGIFLITILCSSSNDDIKDLASELLFHNESQLIDIFKNIEHFRQISSNVDFVYIARALVTTLQATIDSLIKNDCTPCLLLLCDMSDYNGYGCFNTHELPKIPTYFQSFIGGILFASQASDIPVIFSGEGYQGVNLDADVVIMAYLISGCITSAIRACRPKNQKNLTLLMYDGIKPINYLQVDFKQELSKYYSRFVKNADKIIYSGNSQEFGDYVENTYKLDTPRLHFLRYTVIPERLNKKLDFNDGPHVAAITISFDGKLHSPRSNTHKMILSMLEQGIHVHSYSDEAEYIINDFLPTVKPEFRRFLHIHDVIRDQSKLIDELHQYHAGFNGCDHISMFQGMIEMSDRQYSDGMFVYLQSGIPTSLFVYAAAGLPVIVPRYQRSAIEYFGEFSIPVCLSEFVSIRKILENADLPRLNKNYEHLQKLVNIEDKIHKLINFIKDDEVFPETNLSMHEDEIYG